MRWERAPRRGVGRARDHRRDVAFLWGEQQQITAHPSAPSIACSPESAYSATIARSCCSSSQRRSPAIISENERVLNQQACKQPYGANDSTHSHRRALQRRHRYRSMTERFANPSQKDPAVACLARVVPRLSTQRTGLGVAPRPAAACQSSEVRAGAGPLLLRRGENSVA